jgi:hypothetical protein
MKALISGLAAVSILAASASSSFAGQQFQYRKPVGDFGGAHAFAAPMRGFHGAALRPGAGRFAYGHAVRYRRWDGQGWTYFYGDPDYVNGDPAVTGGDTAAAIFGLAALGILQAAGSR